MQSQVYIVTNDAFVVAEAAMLREQAENEAERQKIIREFEEHLKQQREEEEERKKVRTSYFFPLSREE